MAIELATNTTVAAQPKICWRRPTRKSPITFWMQAIFIVMIGPAATPLMTVASPHFEDLSIEEFVSEFVVEALDLSDVEVTPDDLIITVGRSKTDQTGAGHRKGIPGGANPATCPVRAFMAWISIIGQTDGPVFRRIRKGGKVTSDRLTPQVVGLVVKDLAPAMGLDPANVGGHSMRAGFVTDAYAVGAPEASIMATTGHKSHAVMSGYRREANLSKQNAAAMLGL